MVLSMKHKDFTAGVWIMQIVKGTDAVGKQAWNGDVWTSDMWATFTDHFYSILQVYNIGLVLVLFSENGGGKH